MRSLALVVPLALLACTPEANRAAVRVDVTPRFKAGCLVVRSIDRQDPSRAVSSEYAMADQAPNVAYTFAVFRKEDWSRDLELVVQAREASCSGPIVFEERRQVTVPEKDVKVEAVEATAPDADDDGYVASSAARPGTDCNDGDDEMRPGHAEVCDQKDNDCRDGADDGLPFETYWRDADGDLVGVSAGAVTACAAPEGYTLATADADCDDGNALRFPGNAEQCDNLDNDCDAVVDDGHTKQSWYPDSDEDGFGRSSAAAVFQCPPPGPKYVANNGDCDDTTAHRRPRGGVEVACDGIDDDCSGTADDDWSIGESCQDHGTCAAGTWVCSGTTDRSCSGPDPFPWYSDTDGDGDGAGAAVANQCTAPPNTSSNALDCDDLDAARSDGAAEVCDGADNDCDQVVDDGLTGCGPLVAIAADVAVTGAHNWNAISQSVDGRPVWLAGQGGAAAYRNDTSTFYSHDGTCAGDWEDAAILDNNDLILVGPAGKVAHLDGEGPDVFPCERSATTTWTAANVRGVFVVRAGTPTKTWAYLGDSAGRLHRWEVSSSSATPVELNGANTDDSFFDLHGTGPSLMLTVGEQEGVTPFVPRARTVVFTESNNGLSSHIGPPHPMPTGNYSLRGVVVLSSTLGYAVGTGGAFLQWRGGTNWQMILGPTDMGGADFTAVTAAGPNHVYATDSAGRLRRWTGTKWVNVASAPGGVPLRDVSARMLPNGAGIDLWAVGHGGLVLHFHE